jgi:serine acetyltransferase
MVPLKIWKLSARLHRRGHRRLARLLKGFNFIVFHAILPPEVTPGDNLHMEHQAMGVGVHVQSRIGRDVMMFHRVSLAAEAPLGSDRVQVIGDRVTLGLGSIIVGNITVGDDAVVGAGSVVTKDVPPGAVVVGVPARVIATNGREINARRLGRPQPVVPKSPQLVIAPEQEVVQ